MAKTPTPLQNLEFLIETLTEGKPLNENEQEHLVSWLQYTLEQLTSRKIYHKKRQILVKEQVRLLKEHLSADELKALDEQATQAANKQLTVASPEEDEEMEVRNEELPLS